MNCSKNGSLTVQSKLPLVVAIAMLTAPLSGCISSQANPDSMIVGQWQSELAGFVLVTVYTSTEVFGRAPWLTLCNSGKPAHY